MCFFSRRRAIWLFFTSSSRRLQYSWRKERINLTVKGLVREASGKERTPPSESSSVINWVEWEEMEQMRRMWEGRTEGIQARIRWGVEALAPSPRSRERPSTTMTIREAGPDPEGVESLRRSVKSRRRPE